jgi:hypothetical protein
VKRKSPNKTILIIKWDLSSGHFFNSQHNTEQSQTNAISTIYHILVHDNNKAVLLKMFVVFIILIVFLIFHGCRKRRLKD